jgi:hypothetical protein
MKLLTDEPEYKKQAENALGAFSINYEREHCYKNLDTVFEIV